MKAKKKTRVTGGKIEKVAIYARVSTKDKGQDTENQLRELREFAESSGWSVTHEYIDHESAKSGDRAEFQKLLADSSKRKFRAVLVWALDRFTREGIEATFAYLRTLTDGGCDFISYSEPHFRTDGPTGTLMLAIFAWMAEQERRRISERTSAGMETARIKGIKLGRPRAILDRAVVLARHNAGDSIATIARAVSTDDAPVSRETIRRFLRAEVPTGVN